MHAVLENLEPPRLAFLFTGQNAQAGDIGRKLFEGEPVFRDAYEQCDALFARYLPASAQSGSFAFEWALLCLWRSWGIEPALVMGHGPGEYAAACASGVLSLEHAVRLVAALARSMGQKLPPAPDEFQAVAESAPLSDPSITLISSVTGRVVRHGEVNRGEDRRRGFPVRKVCHGLRCAHALGYRVFLALGPKPVPGSLAPSFLEDCLCLPSICEGMDAWRGLLDTLRQLYLRGVPVDWAGFDRPYPRRKLTLPTYPFQRERFWADDCPAGASAAAQPQPLDECFYEVRWEESAALAPAEPANDFLVLPRRFQRLATQLQTLLHARGASCTLIHPDDLPRLDGFIRNSSRLVFRLRRRLRSRPRRGRATN